MACGLCSVLLQMLCAEHSMRASCCGQYPTRAGATRRNVGIEQNDRVCSRHKARARATPTPLRHHLYRHRPFRLSTCQRTKLERHATVVLLARRAVDRYFPRNRHRVGGQKSRLPKLPMPTIDRVPARALFALLYCFSV